MAITQHFHSQSERIHFPLRSHRQLTINSTINTTELKTVPTSSTTNAGIKWETENVKNMSPAPSLNLPPTLKEARCCSSVQSPSCKPAFRYSSSSYCPSLALHPSQDLPSWQFQSRFTNKYVEYVIHFPNTSSLSHQLKCRSCDSSNTVCYTAPIIARYHTNFFVLLLLCPPTVYSPL
jgi:hypothetical protein